MSMFYSFQSLAQGDQTKISVNIAPGTTTGAWLHLPDDYSSTSNNYPLIIFIHGLGEGGTNLNVVLAHGVPKIISRGAKMQFTVGGKLFKFITVSPQISNGWASEEMIQSILDDVKSKYRVDASRIYLTGLSAGGYGVLNYVASGTNYSNNLAAIVPVSTAAIDGVKVPGLCNIASSNIASWFLCGSNDGFIDIQKTYVAKIDGCNPKYPVISTSYAGGTHSDNVWDKAYDATHTYQSPNMYEWMLQYSKGSSPIIIPDPVAAATATNITLPVSSTTLDGSSSTAPGSTIASYAWNLVSGPSTPTFSSTSTAKVTVSNLIAGSYVFNLTVKNATGTSNSKQITVVVTAATAIPAPIAAIASTSVSITLPVSSIEMDGSGSTAPGSTIASYTWSLVSGPSTPVFSSTSTAISTVSSLVTGTYRFNLTVKNAAGGTNSKQATVLVKPAVVVIPPPTTTCSYCKFLITPGTDGGAYINGTNMKVLPGDTVCIQSGNYKYIQFMNFTGTATEPIVFINCGGQVKIGNGGSYGFIFNNVKYFKVTGTGSSDKYGFSINGVATKLNVGLAMGKGCTDYEAAGFEITGSDVGVMAKVNPDCDTNNQYPYFAIRNVKFHDIYIHDVTGEGMYIGNPALNGKTVTCTDATMKIVLPPHFYNLRIYNIITANTGRDGIQVLSAPEDVEIYNNSVSNYGIQNVENQQAGIILGEETNGKIYNNSIIKGTGNGIQILGIGLCYVYNNIISDAGVDGTTTKQDALFIDDRPVKNNFIQLHVNVFNNTIINSGRDAIRYLNSFGTVAKGNLFFNNLLVNPGLGYLNIKTGIDYTASNNLTYSDINAGKFSNAEDKDFHLASGSPAIDKGKDLSAYFKIDIDGDIRSQDTAYDIGADEYASGTIENRAPVSVAGDDTTITLPASTITLNGTGSSDADGNIVSYMWKQVSGPVAATITSASTAMPVINLLPTAGTYVFELIVTDNKGAASSNVVSIILLAEIPVANTDGDKTITQPCNSSDATSMAIADSDGNTIKYNWTQVSGPTKASIASPTEMKTDLNQLTSVGTYIFRLTVTNGEGAESTDDLSVFVKPNPANLLLANAGIDQTIDYVSVKKTVLDGSESYATNNGYISYYAWTKVSGPTGEIFLNAAAPTTVVKLQATGTYVFRLKVTDTNNNTATDDVTIIAGNIGAKTDVKISAKILDVAAMNAPGIQIYPNPVESILHLKLRLNAAATIVARIFSSNGQIKGTYYLGSITSIQKNIDISNLAGGTYILQIRDDKKLDLSYKFIKSN